MLELLSNVISWIVNGIEHILTFIGQIPVFFQYFVRYVNLFIPASMIPFIILGLSIAVFIHIKRLVF